MLRKTLHASICISVDQNNISFNTRDINIEVYECIGDQLPLFCLLVKPVGRHPYVNCRPNDDVYLTVRNYLAVTLIRRDGSS